MIVLFFSIIIVGVFIGMIAAVVKSAHIVITDRNIVNVTLVDKSGKYNTFEIEYTNGSVKTETVPANSPRFQELFEMSRNSSDDEEDEE